MEYPHCHQSCFQQKPCYPKLCSGTISVQEVYRQPLEIGGSTVVSATWTTDKGTGLIHQPPTGFPVTPGQPAPGLSTGLPENSIYEAFLGSTPSGDSRVFTMSLDLDFGCVFEVPPTVVLTFKSNAQVIANPTRGQEFALNGPVLIVDKVTTTGFTIRAHAPCIGANVALTNALFYNLLLPPNAEPLAIGWIASTEPVFT